MEKSELVLHNSENQFVSLGMPFHNNHMMLFMFVILKMIIDLNNSLRLKVALLNLITVSSTWARVIDVMDSEVPLLSKYILPAEPFSFSPLFQIHISLLIQSGSRLFGFIGAGATLGQLFGSLFAASMAWLGPCMYDSLE